MLELVVEEESWERLWPEAKSLAEMHSAEVDGGVEPRRPLRVDVQLMQMMQDVGALKIISARMGGELIGYFTWQVSPDVESEGLLIAQQGAWFVLPGFPRAAHLMFEESIRVLRAAGVECVFPHHRMQGRGRSLGRFFERRGARLIQQTYQLWIGD